MKNQKKATSLRVFAAIFCVGTLLLSGILYYSNGMGNNTEAVKTKMVKTVFKEEVINNEEAEKVSVMTELKELKKTYDDIILNNRTISRELIEERDKVMKLMSDLAALRGGEFSLAKYKSQVKILQERLSFLSLENAVLKKENELITEDRDRTKTVLKESQKNSEDLKQEFEKAVEKGSKLIFSGTTVITYRLKNSGELIVTDKASKVDGINVSFIIGRNEMAKAEDKVYFVQIMNSENAVIGEPNVGTHQYKSLTYSFAINVRYEKKGVHVSENLLGNKFEKGTYYVNIYDKEDLVDESTFTLK